MKHFVKLIRLSSKEAFLKLRSLGKIHCKAIEKDFIVTNLFLRHISWSSKNREIHDIIERLSCINLIEKIWAESVLIDTRENVIIDGKKKFQKTFKVKTQMKDFEFFLVLWEKSSQEIILISVFFNFLDK